MGAARFTPLALKITCILFSSWANAHQDAAFLQPLLVMLHALLRNARANERAHETTRGASCASTGERGRQRSRYDQAEARYRDRSADRCNRRRNCANVLI